MSKKMYNSLSMGVHVELLIRDENVCLKVWQPISKEEFEGPIPSIPFPERSLGMPALPKWGEFPQDTVGVYHNKLPTGIIYGEQVNGEVFLPGIPESIRGNYEKLKEMYFRNTAYSWIDPTDPSISSGEQSDVACWVIGIHPNFGISASYNSLASTYQSKAHPLRSVRQQSAPACLMLYKIFTDDKFTDCSLTMKYNKGYGFSTNIIDGWIEGDGYNYLKELPNAMPSFVVTSGGSSITADGHDTVNFKMVDKDNNLIEKNSEAYLESTGGYLPKTRVPITNGLGSFKVTALGLEADDTFKIKIGFRNLTGIEDVNYTVT